MDTSDPGTQAYIKAMDKKAFDDIGKAATVTSILTPISIAGTIASYVGPASSLASNAIDGSLEKAGTKEITQFAVGEYFKKIYGISAAAATRITSIVDMSGGWQAFVDRTLNYASTGSDDKGNEK